MSQSPDNRDNLTRPREESEISEETHTQQKKRQRTNESPSPPPPYSGSRSRSASPPRERDRDVRAVDSDKASSSTHDHETKKEQPEEILTMHISGFPPNTSQRELHNICRFLPGFVQSTGKAGSRPVGFALFANRTDLDHAIKQVNGFVFEEEVLFSLVLFFFFLSLSCVVCVRA